MIWGLEVEEFKLERYLDLFIDYCGKDLNYILFGLGRRICFGIGFVLGLVEVVVVNFVG